MKIKEVFSSGGVGDTLIVGLKIQNLQKQFPDTKIIWHHFEKHGCHYRPCVDIMRQFVHGYGVHILDKPEQAAKNACKNKDGEYITTEIRGFGSPYLSSPLGDGSFLLSNPNIISLNNHIVVQAQAGRMKDNTRREIGPKIICKLLDKTNKTIVIVGPEYCDYSFTDNKRIINLAGQTPSIIDALSLINDCSLFVGQDGIMAYYAMMLKKWTIVAYHLPNLINHYWNMEWANHSLGLTGAGSVLNMLPKHGKIDLILKAIES